MADEERMLPEESEELKEADSETDSEEDVVEASEEEEVEETVNLKKSEYEKLLEERDNYKKATLSLKKKPQPEEKPKAADDEVPITRGEFYKNNEKQAIKWATTVSEDDPEEIASVKQEIDANWDTIVPYIHATDKSTPDAIYDAILDGHAAWKRRQKPKAEDDKKVKAELSQTHGLGAKTSLKNPLGERKKVLKRAEGMETWYAKKQ